MFAAWLCAALVLQSGLPQAQVQPLSADAAGITVQAGGQLLHRIPVRYPPEALQARIGGTVVLELTLDGEGAVSKARVLAGPQELRRGALESVLQWHYLREGVTVQATVEFRPPDSVPPSVSAAKASMKPGITDHVIESFDVAVLPEPLQSMVRVELASFQGQPLTPETLASVTNAAREVDRHLIVSPLAGPKFGTVAVLLPGTSPVSGAAQMNLPPPTGKRLPVAGDVQATKLVESSPPAYPPLARQARIQGTVRFMALIGKDGHVAGLQLISGHPLLVAAAGEAANKYVYQPTLLNGEPVEVVAQIDVNFTLQ